MFELGEIIISEKAIKEVSLDFIYESIQEYLKEAKIYMLKEDDKEKRIFHSCLENEILFKMDFIVDGKIILYIETYKDKEKGTSILEGQEYLKRYIGNFAYHLTAGEKDFLKVVLNQYEEGTKYEQNVSGRISRKFANLESKKSMLIKENNFVE